MTCVCLSLGLRFVTKKIIFFIYLLEQYAEYKRTFVKQVLAELIKMYEKLCRKE